MTLYCPDPGCPTRARTGHAAEYVPGTARCADCGAELVADDPVPAERRRPWPAPLRRRLGVTGLCAILAVLAPLLPSPFLDIEAATRALRTTWPWLSMQFGPFALGIMPVLSGFVLVELVALAVPRWNRRRHGDPGFRHRLLIGSLCVGLALALLQAYLHAIWLESTGPGNYTPGYEMSFIDERGVSFRLSYAFTAAAGTMLLALVALVISRHGVGNGFALLLLLEFFSSLPVALIDLGPALARDEPPGVWLFGGLLCLLLMGVIALIFHRSPRTPPGGPPLFLPTSGILPIEIGLPLLLLPASFLSLVDLPWLARLADATMPGSSDYLLIQLGLIAAIVPLGSWLYWWRFRDRLRRPGVARAWIGAQLWTAALLGALVFFWHGLFRVMPPGVGSRLSLLWLIPVVVILMDLVIEVRARRDAPNAADLVPLADYQHPAEALEDARGRAPEVGAVVQGLRFRSLHYFFAPEVPCRVLGVAPPAPKAVDGDPPVEDGLASSAALRNR